MIHLSLNNGYPKMCFLLGLFCFICSKISTLLCCVLLVSYSPYLSSEDGMATFCFKKRKKEKKFKYSLWYLENC